jgi:hypothetical protein
MKNNIDAFIGKSLEALNEISTPTMEQKYSILNTVLHQSKTQNASIILKIKNIVFINPWRFAIGASVFQAVALTGVFGSKYTNLIFQLLGR